MSMPVLKLRQVVGFPGNIVGGVGIDATKAHGAVTIDTDWSEFATISTIPTSPSNNILTFDTATGVYTMVPSSLFGGGGSGVADAPINGNTYGRNSAAWTRAVAASGDIMTGNLAISKAASGQNSLIAGFLGNTSRWTVELGSSAAESGSNAGSDFVISRYSDGGSYLGSPLSINRANGVVSTGPVNVAGVAGSPAMIINDLGATTSYHAVQINRTEALPLGVDTESGQNAPLSINVHANNVSAGTPGLPPIAQPVGLLTTVTQVGTGDAVGLMGLTYNSSTNGAAFGAFFQATATGTAATNGAIGLGLGIINNTGQNHAFSPSGPWYVIGVDIPYASSVPVNGEAAILIRSSNGAWDTGIGFASSSVGTYIIKHDNFFVTASGDIATRGQFNTSLSAAAKPQFDITSAPGIVIAQGAHAKVIGGGAGMMLIGEYTAAGDTALYLIGNSLPVQVSSVTGLFQATSSTTPASGKISVAAVGSDMHVYNNQGSSVTVKAMFFRFA